MRISLTSWLMMGSAVMLCISWLMPNHYRPWTSFHAEVAAVLSAALMFLAILSRRSVSSSISPLAILLFAMAAIPLVQLGAGQIAFVGDASLATLYLVGAALCVWMGGAQPEAVKDQCSTGLAVCFAMVGILSTGIALYQWFGLSGLEIWAVDGEPGGRATGNLAQSNHLATVLLCAVVSCILLHANRQIGTPVTILMSGFILMGAAMAQSRTTWVAAGVIIGFARLRKQRCFPQLRITSMAVLGLGILFGACFWAAAWLPKLLLLSDGTGDARLEVGLRPLLWRQITFAIGDSPWIGYGWLQGHIAQGVAALSVSGLEYSSYSHNLVLDLMIWNGAPLGAAITVAFVAWYVRASWKAEGQHQWFRWTVITCIAVHMMLEYPHAYTYLLFPCAFCMGQLEPMRERLPARDQRGVIAFIGAAALTVFVAVVRDYLMIERDGQLLRMELARIGGIRATELAPNTIVLDQMEASIRVARIEASPGMNSKALDELLLVARRYPNQFFLPRAIVALALNNRESEARVELRRFRGIHGEVEYARAIRMLHELADIRFPMLKTFLRSVGNT